MLGQSWFGMVRNQAISRKAPNLSACNFVFGRIFDSSAARIGVTTSISCGSRISPTSYSSSTLPVQLGWTCVVSDCTTCWCKIHSLIVEIPQMALAQRIIVMATEIAATQTHMSLDILAITDHYGDKVIFSAITDHQECECNCRNLVKRLVSCHSVILVQRIGSTKCKS